MASPGAGRPRQYRSLSFGGLIGLDLASRKVRTILTAAAVAISVMAIVILVLFTVGIVGALRNPPRG